MLWWSYQNVSGSLNTACNRGHPTFGSAALIAASLGSGMGDCRRASVAATGSGGGAQPADSSSAKTIPLLMAAHAFANSAPVNCVAPTPRRDQLLAIVWPHAA